MKKSNLSFLLVLLFWMPFAEKASKIFANKPLHRCYYRISNYHEDGKDEKALYSIDSLLKTQTEINSTLRGNIQKLKGDICLDLAQYENALEAYKASYALRLETYGEVQNGTLDSKNGIAETIFRLGDIDSALELHREILELRIEKDGEYSSDVADSYNNLGNCYFSKGLNEKAIDYHNYALNIRKYALSKVGNRFDDGIAVSYFNLGNIYFQEGKFEIALSYYQSAKENRHVRWRPPHPKLSKINFAIAKCLLHQGNLKDGIPLAENALEVFTNRFNQNHPILLNYYQTYASLLLNRGALNEALEYYQRLIKSDRARFKFIGLNNAGLVLQKMGDYESAIEYHTRAFEITKEEIGFTESDQAQVFLNVANAYFREGNVKLAKTAYENLLSFYGKNPPALLLNNLGLCELDLGNLAEANQFFNQAIAKADSLEEFEYQLNQVIAFRQMGKLQKAYREVLKLEPNTEKEELDWLLQVLELGIQLENEVALESQFETAIEKVNNLSRRILDPISRLKFRGNFQRIYQLATLYYSKKWKQTNDLAAFEKAFSIAEKGKSLTLLESVIQKQLTSFAGVPNEVLEEEIQILQKGNQLEFENLLEELKSNYPQYYELKFAAPSISLEAVQELLNPNQTLLSYSL